MKVVSLGGSLGARVENIDLNRELAADEILGIRQAWLDHLVLVFPDQSIDTDGQIRFAGYFGVPEGVPQGIGDGSTGQGEGTLRPMYIANRDVDGSSYLPSGEMYFHSDQSYMAEPSMATTLYAIEVPEAGGDTLFANCYRAYSALPESTRRQISSLRALNVYDYAVNPTKPGEPSLSAERHVHPLVVQHPESRRLVLFANRLMTARIVDLPEGDGRFLLRQLFDEVERQECLYRHVWHARDLVMWDNRCTLHARTSWDAAEARVLRRISIRGWRPAGV
jgi:taurine dioxygenase